MSGIAKEWAIFLSLFLFIIGSTVFEAAWVKRRGWASFGRALGFSALTNFIGYSVGFFVFFVIVGVIMAMAWDGSIKNFPMKDYGLAVALIFAVLFVPTALMLCKRLFLSALKIQTGKSAWLYAVASSVLSLTVSLGAPVLLGYVLS
jgi:hypothetical protein